MKQLVGDARFEPGWLMRTCHDASIRCMTDHSPGFFERGPLASTFKRPVSRSEADEIFARMDARFKQWTGRTIAEYLETR